MLMTEYGIQLVVFEFVIFSCMFCSNFVLLFFRHCHFMFDVFANLEYFNVTIRQQQNGIAY